MRLPGARLDAGHGQDAALAPGRQAGGGNRARWQALPLFPARRRVDFATGKSKRLVDRLFGGSAAGLFAHLAEAEALTDKDLNQIEALLKELRK